MNAAVVRSGAEGEFGAPPPVLTTIAIGVAGAAVLTWSLAMGLTGPDMDRSVLRTALSIWLTAPYLVAGLIASRRRPDSRLGPLMVGAGLLTCLDFLVNAANDLLFTIGLAADALPPVLFLHVFLAYPSGRLPSRADRIVVGLGYATVGVDILRLLLGAEAPRNLLAVVVRPELQDPLLIVRLIGIAIACVAGVVVLQRRRLRERPVLRPMVNRLADAFVVGLLAIALLAPAALFEWPIFGQVRLAAFFLIGLAPFVFLLGLLQARLARGSVATLMLELQRNPGPVELRAAVARALRDPSAAIAYWLPEFDSFADADGHVVDVEAGPDRAATPIVQEGRPVAMLLHDPQLDDEPDLLSSVAAAVGMAIENAQLQVELRARVEELRGSRIRILDAGREERRRLERDLHDGAQQRLVALSLELGRLEHQVSHDPALSEVVRTARQEVAGSLTELRDLAHGIHPSVVTDHGLAVALEALATRSPVPCRIAESVQGRLPESVEMAAYFVVSESLANVAKHAGASSVVVNARQRDGRVVVDVSDDGVGGVATDGGSGLRGLADRVESLGGRLEVWSPEGVGTRVRAEIPCAS